ARVRRDHVMIEDHDEVHAEGNYYLEWWDGGKRYREAAGPGTRVPLKCGKVRKGAGLMDVTIQAFDPNMSQVAATARGNWGLSVPVVDITATPLSKTATSLIKDT